MVKKSNIKNHISKIRYLNFALCILTFAFLFDDASAEISQESARKAFTAAEFANGVALHDYTLVDQDGKEFRLKSYFGQGKPLLVSFIYTSCAVECPTITNSVASSIKEVQKELGDNFNVLSISFDPERDTPERLREYGRHFVENFNTIRFATGSEDEIKMLTKEFGFYFEKADQGFRHLNMVSVVSADGRLYKQVYSSRIVSEDIRKPLKELITGQIPVESPPSLIDQFKQFCSSFDPVSGKYSLNYPAVISIFMQLAVMVTIAYFIAAPRVKSFLHGPIKRR